MKKQAKELVMAEEEMQTNIAQTETFTLPSGQEIEKENILSKADFFVLYMYLMHDM